MNTLQSLIESLYEHECAFYRNIWKGERQFERLPFLRKEHLFRTPLRERTYKREKGLAKIVRDGGDAYLTQWGLSDLAREEYQGGGMRPLVLFANTQEALEKCLWYYERNTLPLTGDTRNLPATAHAAMRYNIDALLSDEDSAMHFFAALAPIYDMKKITSVTIVGSSARAQLSNFSVSQVTRVFALPETGALGTYCPHARSEEAAVHADSNTLFEVNDDALVVTKRTLLVTPIIRYFSGIPASFVRCNCGKEGIRLI